MSEAIDHSVCEVCDEPVRWLVRDVQLTQPTDDYECCQPHSTHGFCDAHKRPPIVYPVVSERRAFISRQFLDTGDPAEVIECIRGVFADGADSLAVRDEQELGAALVFCRVEDVPE